MKTTPAVGQRWMINNYSGHSGPYLIVEIEGPGRLKVLQAFVKDHTWPVGGYVTDGYESLLRNDWWIYLEGQDATKC